MSEEPGPSRQGRRPSTTTAAAAARERRAAETADQSELRRQTSRERAAMRRASETVEQQQSRLQADQQRAAARRNLETPDQRGARLQADQQRAADRRAVETNQQRELRRQVSREREGRRRRNVVPPVGMYKAAVSGTDGAMPPELHNLGVMTKECEHNFCRALHFDAEKGNLLHSCCHNGKVLAPPLSPYPAQLHQLLTGDTQESRNFREFIRQYNSANAFASFGAKSVPIPGQGPYCFKISGEVYHYATSALVQDPQQQHRDIPEPRYGQVFVHDPAAAVAYRMRVQENAQCDRAIMQIIDTVLREVSPYAQQYRRLHEAAQEEEERSRRLGLQPKEYELRLVQRPTDDQRRYNAPTTNKECMYLIESGAGEVPAMDLAVHPRGERGCTRLSPNSRHVDPMTFSLFFPQGDSGYYVGVQNAQPLTNQPRNISPLQFYASRIAVRPGQFNQLHHGAKLFQQYIVHAYCIVEYNRLSFIRHNQTQLRVECYQGLIEFLAAAAVERTLRPGNVVILPSTYVGSPRYMQQKYLDAMTIVRKFGRPDLFVTFTCNPKWPEILSQLEPYQDASARPDIVARVFQLKVEELMRLIKKEKIFGAVVAYLYVIEFQKRGLPHVHSLFWLCEADQLHTGDDVDRVISAEIPDKDEDPVLYEIIMRNNIHGPCGLLNPNCICMRNGTCSKQFPKPFQDATDISGEGYPKYRRRDNSDQQHFVRNMPVDNGWVVPYNAFLSKTFNAHINVEMCHTIQAIKYLLKYFTKGHDRAQAALQVRGGEVVLNEVDNFVDTRCITPPEAAWRLLENDIHDQSHAVYLLAVHLPNGQSVFFEQGQEEEAARRASVRDTTLTAWFKLNQVDPLARNTLYQDIPNTHVIQKQGGTVRWKIRERDYPTIGRVASVSPRMTELYHLRLILLSVPGATSFEYLRTVNGVEYPTFRQAALALELVIDDGEWRRCLQEASLYMMPYQLRALFAVILINCEVTDSNALWQEFQAHMTEDFRHRGNDDASSTTLALLQIQADLQAVGSSWRTGARTNGGAAATASG